jgi:putative phosphoesterase
MKIAVVSDSHGNIEYLSEFTRKLRALGKFDFIVHLGDDSPDIEALKGFKVISVPGVYENAYSIPGTRRRLIEEFNGIQALITHTPTKHTNDLPNEPSPEELVWLGGIDIVLYGHTHIPKIEVKKVTSSEHTFWINPGHMKKDDERGCEASYAILEIQKKQKRQKKQKKESTVKKISIEICDFLTDKVLMEIHQTYDRKQRRL